MLCLFGINLKKQTKTFKIHTQERKSGYLHQHQSKSRCFFFFFFFPTMAHGMTCTQLSGKETKNRNGKGGLPGWPYQNEDDYKGREEHATQNRSFM